MVDLLVTVRPEQAERYQQQLAATNAHIVTSTEAAQLWLADRDHHIDVLVLDNGVAQGFQTIDQLRVTYPRLLIVLVDEEADFATPGHADDISTDPFTNDDLMRRIKRLMSDRQLETLRADTMPPIREFAKKLRKAVGEIGKQQAAVTACREMGYDYVGLYKLESLTPLRLTLRAQDGTAPIQAVAPKQATPEDLLGWVATTGQSRITGPTDELNHPLVRKGRLGAAVCVPIGRTNRYGVLVACNDKPGTITNQQILMLELISAQLAAVISKET